ncbi:MAG: ABC transporter ATP-binding protein [Microthrixaceae bacterium]
MSRRSTSSSDRRDIVVSLDGVAKEYGDVGALAPVDLQVEAGESVVLVGHNGSGKSTLLSIVAGMLEPSDGVVQVHGQEPDSMYVRQRRSWLPDNPVLYDDLSVREHLEYTIRMHGGDGDEPIIDDLIQRLGLGGREDDLPSQFSRGLRQKAAAAVALVRPFTLLLVDEPFVGLDAAGRKSFLGLLDEAREGGATILVATHDPEVIDRFERGLVLDDGHLIHDGPAKSVHEFVSPDFSH